MRSYMPDQLAQQQQQQQQQRVFGTSYGAQAPGPNTPVGAVWVPPKVCVCVTGLGCNGRPRVATTVLCCAVLCIACFPECHAVCALGMRVVFLAGGLADGAVSCPSFGAVTACRATGSDV
jgi:hypothetical protein